VADFERMEMVHHFNEPKYHHYHRVGIEADDLRQPSALT
jgi:hypothetical protein